MRIEVISLIIIVLLSISVLLWDSQRQRPPERCISYQTATTTVERLKDWSTWLTGVATAAMAAMGLLAKDRELLSGQRRCGFFALLFLGFSLLLSVWLVASLPGILLQLSIEASTLNDLYRHPYDTFTGVQLPGLLVLQHLYFVVGVGCFAVMIYLMFPYCGQRKHDA